MSKQANNTLHCSLSGCPEGTRVVRELHGRPGSVAVQLSAACQGTAGGKAEKAAGQNLSFRAVTRVGIRTLPSVKTIPAQRARQEDKCSS